MAQQLAPRWLVPLLLLSLALQAGAATRNNDDSCDISVMPAATLLLPYFEVDLDDPAGETTIVTITNASSADAIAAVTLWTDRAYPIINFYVYLTGYDVQALNLYDVIERGIIAPDAGTGTEITDRGDYSVVNPRLDLRACDRLPGQMDDAYRIRMQSAFLEGTFPELGTLPSCAHAGGEHDNAVGYATIDVVGNCQPRWPDDPGYWSHDIRYDNVLLGDYQQVNHGENFAQGGPLVHIRAIPEGGTPGERRTSDTFERTFYARFQSPLTPNLDGRQPLPSQFAVRWVQGSDSEFQTSLKIWREGRLGTGASCEDYASEDALAIQEIAVFDEDENAAGSGGNRYLLGATSRTSVDDADAFPQLGNGAHGGWMYVNLDRSARDEIASQAWIISSMRAEQRYSVDVEAVALGNGCSAPAARSEVYASSGPPIAPAPNDSKFAGGTATTDNDASCDIALLPAATLLLPYFEVDLDPSTGPPTGGGGPPPPPPGPPRDPTIFTVVNVSPRDQIARVTLWTDYSYPVLSFNIYLTGYDAQSINLFDVISRGIVAPENGTGTFLSDRGPHSDRNPGVDLDDCGRVPGQLPEAYVAYMQQAFMEGTVPDRGDLAGCNNVGNEHDNAVGYATIDLVRNCSTNDPSMAAYWTEDLAYDNVLVGDYQQVDPRNDFASGSPLVHIRAIPEGGTIEERRALPRKYDAGFARTFYARYQPALSPKLDGRQPLPSVFAARWLEGGTADFETYFKVWREGKTGRSASCATHDDNVVKVMEVVRFDEAENAWGDVPVSRVCTPITVDFTLPATSLTSTDDSSIYPQADNGSVGGWIYLNLDNCEFRDWASSNWVVASMRAEGRYSVDIDAAALGNGCTPDTAISEITTGSGVIGPSANANP